MFRTVLTLLTLAIAALAFTTGDARAEIITRTTAQGDGADATIRTDSNSGVTSGPATTTYNGGTLDSKHSNSGFGTRYPLLRFDLGQLTTQAALDVPTIADASIDLVLTSNLDNDSGSNIAWSLYGMVDGTIASGGLEGETWSEATVTWNKIMGSSRGASSNPPGRFVNLGSITVSEGAGAQAGDVVSITASGLTGGSQTLLNFLQSDTDGLVSFLLVQTTIVGGSIQNFASNTNATYAAPTLTVDADLIPEPASIALLGLGGLLMFRHRKRI